MRWLRIAALRSVVKRLDQEIDLLLQPLKIVAPHVLACDSQLGTNTTRHR